MWVGGMAAAGVIVSHSLSYLFVTPDPHARERLLQVTGHRYFTWVAALALGALVGGLAGGTLRRLRSGGDGPVTGPRAFAAAASTLSVLQVAGFIGLEAAERWIAGSSITHILGEPVVAIGIAMQVVVALVAALLLVGLARGVDHIASRLLAAGPSGRSSKTVTWWATSIHPPSLAPVDGGRTLRGPPPSPS